MQPQAGPSYLCRKRLLHHHSSQPIGLTERNYAGDHSQSDAVLQREAEEVRLSSDQSRRRTCDGNRLRRDHLAGHTARGVGRDEQNVRHADLENPPLRAETLEFRLVFECAAARFAAQRSTPEELSRLKAILLKMRNAVAAQDVEAEAVVDGEFHLALTAASHNRMLDQFYASVITMLREHIAANTFDATVNNSNAAIQSTMRLSQHESIYFAVRERNADAAQQAMFTHIDFVGKQFGS